MVIFKKKKKSLTANCPQIPKVPYKEEKIFIIFQNIKVVIHFNLTSHLRFMHRNNL